MRPALLIIDMQKDFVLPDAPLCVAGAQATIPTLQRLLGRARAAGWPVFHIVREHKADGSDAEVFRRSLFGAGKRGFCVAGQPGSAIVDELTPLPSERVLIKTRFSAFYRTTLAEELAELGINTVILAGTQYPNCIRGTAVDAIYRDLRTIVVSDACSAATPEVAAANIFDMKNMGIEVLRLEELDTLSVQTWQSWHMRASRRLAASLEECSPRREAELLMCHALKVTREQIVLRRDRRLNAEELRLLESLLARREKGEPLAYLTGEKEFYARIFSVNEATLVPRPETEHLVDAALALFDQKRIASGISLHDYELPFVEELTRALDCAPLGGEAVRYLDLGTGSGCIALTLAAEQAAWRGLAVDISEKALATAQLNAKNLHLDAQVGFLLADFGAPDFIERLPEAFRHVQLIVSNPPYVSEEEYAELDCGVRDFEPKSALVPGPSGLEDPQVVVNLAGKMLQSGGLLLMEHGAEQGDAIRAMCDNAIWRVVLTGKDYAGLDRYLLAIHR